MLAICAYYSGIMLNAFATYSGTSFIWTSFNRTLHLPNLLGQSKISSILVLKIFKHGV